MLTRKGCCIDTSTLSYASLVTSGDAANVVCKWLKASDHTLCLSHVTSTEPPIMTSTYGGVVCDGCVGVLRTGPFQVK